MRVNFDALEQAESTDQLLFDGLPFTGVAFELSPTGQLLFEGEFKDGIENGRVRCWDVNGQLLKDFTARGGAFHGRVRQWHETGTMASDGEYEFGIRVRERRWSPDGQLAEDYAISEKEPAYRSLSIIRENRREP